MELGDFEATYLSQVLAPLEQRAEMPRSELTQLRESFIDRASKALPAEKIVYQAAVAVCNVISQAMDERDQAITNIQSSSAVRGSYDLGERRKDRPSWKDLEREAREEERRREDRNEKDYFLNTQLRTNWQQRTIQLRRTINLLYARERETERRTPAAGATGAVSVADTITLDKPIQVKVKYGTAIIPAGTVLSIAKRDATAL
jgi:hypothetical protein